MEGFVCSILNSSLGEQYVKTDQEVFGVRNNYIRITIEPERLTENIL